MQNSRLWQTDVVNSANGHITCRAGFGALASTNAVIAHVDTVFAANVSSMGSNTQFVSYFISFLNYSAAYHSVRLISLYTPLVHIIDTLSCFR
jgi:hypothetical protein